MATYKAQIGACNGYTSHEVQVSGVVTQSAAKKALQATHPGASIRSIQFISNKDWSMTSLQIQFTQKAARDFRRKAAESAKSIADMSKEIVIV